MHLAIRARANAKGFTLAEVLITLGIIGIVAAITMPTLIANYQKQATINKIKKFYKNMNQVLAQAQVDNGEFSSWDYKSSDDYAEMSKNFYINYIKPYIKNVDDVQTNVFLQNDINGGVRFVFADGTQAILSANYSNLTRSDSDYPAHPIIIFYTKAQKHSDINSNYIKHPTKERFYFIINDNGILVPPNLSKTRENNINECKKSSGQTNNGNITCSTVIYKDGWKIAPDYPW